MFTKSHKTFRFDSIVKSKHTETAITVCVREMVKSATTKDDAHALFHSLRSAYSATPTNLKIIDLYVVFAVFTALIQVVYMAIVGSFPFNSFLSGVLSCVGTAVLAVCLRIQVNKENKEFKDLPPERAFADFVLCNLVLHLVIMNFLG
ncbi:putative dolichyl-diphosphooligosaccharide--protein glycotransferase [Helianthus annuus]|uniref:Dolichyl-diphosphooligosaccharide--protein glycosyltransferase subunit DAD1 n=2 Tax=Helianthus annuus TaxID=4232 RepID=A0A9K3HDL7_HELAN|nr:putative dolichyl-diphosphooligosaccharide--protein glycotransferase [Helianthus annuus]KAJ0475497.1 putative dolichyl-diphosphooligosaccharide--protein glycotransferase [Helianthus annuus]KAJ0498797.1 putative dolichyl-diphosphooligosaccharide--protein glycotransferase [Helianthus annuus]KAJ0664817.1 putative dolichyl-diphosphooligosaccharide--protein glycotransferase [Helianthus annuus]KAJ0672257.1 putative dolichyl-diphosphooligosaccharide--protein glycotransferase [Helianthus annuus]